MKKLVLATLLTACAFSAGQLMAGPPDTCGVCQWACDDNRCVLLGCISRPCN